MSTSPGHRTRKALELAGLDAAQIAAVAEYLRDDLAVAARSASAATFQDAERRALARVDTENASRTALRTKADDLTLPDEIRAEQARVADACEQRRDAASSLAALYRDLATLVAGGKIPVPGGA